MKHLRDELDAMIRKAANDYIENVVRPAAVAANMPADEINARFAQLRDMMNLFVGDMLEMGCKSADEFSEEVLWRMHAMDAVRGTAMAYRKGHPEMQHIDKLPWAQVKLLTSEITARLPMTW